MQRFIGRRKELKILRGLLEKPSSSLAVVRGRRRIGKSRLIAEFGKELESISISGIPPSKITTAQSQRDEFARQIARALAIPLPRSDNWSDLLWTLATHTREGRILIVLDEISWLGSKDPEFLSHLKQAWDRDFSQNPQLILILCGSVSSWIEKNILKSTGFYGRISTDLVLTEMPLSDCAQFWACQGSNTAAYEILKILSVTGGIPRYLEEIDPRLSAEQNIERLCFHREGILFNEFEYIFHDLFSSRSEMYRKIVLRLAEGPATLTDIYDALSIQPTGACLDYMNDLIQAGFVVRDYTWNLKNQKRSNLSLFRLKDNYLRFYLKIIEPHKSEIEKGAFGIKNLSGWGPILGLQFESLALSNYLQLCHFAEIPLDEVMVSGPFFKRPANHQFGCQIDLLIQTRYNCLYLFEFKFSKDPLRPKVINEIKEKIERLQLPRGYSIKPILVHVGGVSSEVTESRFFSRIIDFTTLLDL